MGWRHVVCYGCRSSDAGKVSDSTRRVCGLRLGTSIVVGYCGWEMATPTKLSCQQGGGLRNDWAGLC